MEHEKKFDGDEEYVPLVIREARLARKRRRAFLALCLDELRIDGPTIRGGGDYGVPHRGPQLPLAQRQTTSAR